MRPTEFLKLRFPPTRHELERRQGVHHIPELNDRIALLLANIPGDESMTENRVAHPLDLTGRVAIITGGNRGIGLGIAKGLVAAGCNVAIWSRDGAQNHNAVSQCSGGPGVASAFVCDVTDLGSLEKALAETIKCFGAIDGLFANAGIGGGGRTPFLEQTDDEWRRLLEVNLLGTKRTLVTVLRHMVNQARSGRTGGRIVVTSSVAANLGTAFNQHYAATKSGLIAITRAVAIEFARYGITANALLPGYTKTEMIDDLLDNERFLKAIEPRLPLKRLATAEDFGGIAIYLMSGLSSYHTGDTITIDGGFSLS
jgi:NAD(P)-dependent dehydrogenase (short-subunit alcohol dehydrogenase family)